MSRIRNACITSFAEEITYDTEKVTYLVSHRERCPETNNLHYHVYVEFKSAYTLATIKKIFNDNTIHIEKRKGSQKQAIEYVLKETNEYEVEEFGESKKQGARTDIKNAIELVKAGKTNLELIEETPVVFLKYNRGLEKVRFTLNQASSKCFRALEVTVLTGPPGCGKTRAVYDKHGFEDVYKLDAGNNIWFDGYEGQDILLIDDFYGWIKWGFLLNILDGYPLRLECKGSHTWANWKKVYITSNKEHTEWYTDKDPAALIRRITKIERMKNTENESPGRGCGVLLRNAAGVRENTPGGITAAYT